MAAEERGELPAGQEQRNPGVKILSGSGVLVLFSVINWRLSDKI